MKPTKPTIEDVILMINNLATEMRDGFNKINIRLDRVEQRLDIIEEKLERNNIR